MVDQRTTRRARDIGGRDRERRDRRLQRLARRFGRRCGPPIASWEYRPAQAGWGRYEDVLETIEQAIGKGPYLLGERFSMADVIFGGTLRYMLAFKMIEARPAFVSYTERLSDRPAAQAAQAKNAAMTAEHRLAP